MSLHLLRQELFASILQMKKSRLGGVNRLLQGLDSQPKCPVALWLGPSFPQLGKRPGVQSSSVTRQPCHHGQGPVPQEPGFLNLSSGKKDAWDVET